MAMRRFLVVNVHKREHRAVNLAVRRLVGPDAHAPPVARTAFHFQFPGLKRVNDLGDQLVEVRQVNPGLDVGKRPADIGGSGFDAVRVTPDRMGLFLQRLGLLLDPPLSAGGLSAGACGFAWKLRDARGLEFGTP